MTDEEIAKMHGVQWSPDEPRLSNIDIEQRKGTNARVLAAIAAARREQHAECVRLFRDIVQKWLDAYPTSIFGLVTDAEREEHGNLITRNSAAMGRHMATQLIKQIGELESQKP